MADRVYRAVLFDMDGVIVDSMDIHAGSWQSVFGEYGILISKEEIFKREGMSGVASIVDVIKDKGFPVPDEREQAALLEKKLEIFEKHTAGIFPEIEEILRFLSSKGLLLGLVTGSLKRSVLHVLPSRLYNIFDVVVTINDIERGKPHPEPYLTAAGRLSCKPEESLVIENAPLGIQSAKSAGMDCFALKTTLPADYLVMADRTFQNHAELHEYLKKIFV